MRRQPLSARTHALCTLGVAACLLAAPCELLAEDCPAIPDKPDAEDLLWLEGTGDLCVRAWVHAENERTRAALTVPALAEAKRVQRRTDAAGVDAASLTTMRKYRGYVYRLVAEGERPAQRLLRASTSDEFDGEERWQTVVSVAELELPDGNWRMSLAASRFSPSGKRLLLAISDAGSDVVILREVAPERAAPLKHPFQTHEPRKLSVEYASDDTLYLASAQVQNELSVAGYSLVVREWHRGSDLSSAPVIHRGSPDLLMVAVSLVETASFRQPVLLSLKDFASGARVAALPLPGATDVEPEWLPFRLPALQTFAGIVASGSSLLLQYDPSLWALDALTAQPGDWLALDVAALVNGVSVADATSLVYRPRKNEGTFFMSSSSGAFGVGATRHGFLLVIMSDLYQRLSLFSGSDDGDWVETVVSAEQPAGLSVALTGDPFEKTFLVGQESFGDPSRVLLVDPEGNDTRIAGGTPASGDAPTLRVRRQFAVADDGVAVPYFLVTAAGVPVDTQTLPVLMTGYGAFGISVSPAFDVLVAGSIHRSWLMAGGAYVVVGARGGGEYGPDWHEAARLSRRQRSYDDFHAVAEDLVQRGVTRGGAIAWIGASNGGLTAGVLATQRPDLYGASVAFVPVLDMARYHRLLAGPNWIPEYGDPEDPAMHEYLLGYSPLHNIDAAPVAPMLLVTTTSDDRVHPGHARKMAARLQAFGHDAYFLEYEEGGHLLALSKSARAELDALVLAFLLRELQSGAIGAGGAAATQ